LKDYIDVNLPDEVLFDNHTYYLEQMTFDRRNPSDEVSFDRSF